MKSDSKSFSQFLDWASATVSKWPRWKLNVLGKPMAEKDEHFYCDDDLNKSIIFHILLTMRNAVKDIRRRCGNGDSSLLGLQECMVVLTTVMEEHIEHWDEPCGCSSCRAYYANEVVGSE